MPPSVFGKRKPGMPLEETLLHLQNDLTLYQAFGRIVQEVLRQLGEVERGYVQFVRIKSHIPVPAAVLPYQVPKLPA